MNEDQAQFNRQKRELEESIRQLRRENAEEQQKLTHVRAWGEPSSPDKIRSMVEMTPMGRNLTRGA